MLWRDWKRQTWILVSAVSKLERWRSTVSELHFTSFLSFLVTKRNLNFNKLSWFKYSLIVPTVQPVLMKSLPSTCRLVYKGSVQFSCSVVSDYLWPPWTATRQASLSITNSWSSPKSMSIKSVMPSNNLILCHPLLLLPSIFPSIRVFSNESPLRIRWPKYWSFSFSITPSNEHPGLISFRMDWLDLLEVQGPLKSLLQHHSWKASILQRLAFFIVQLSHPYMTTGKTIALTRWTVVGKVVSLLFNMLSRLIITFLPRIKHLLISWLQSPSAVILEPRKIVSHCFFCFPIYLPWSDRTVHHDLSFLNVEL